MYPASAPGLKRHDGSKIARTARPGSAGPSGSGNVPVRRSLQVCHNPRGAQNFPVSREKRAFTRRSSPNFLEFLLPFASTCTSDNPGEKTKNLVPPNQPAKKLQQPPSNLTGVHKFEDFAKTITSVCALVERRSKPQLETFGNAVRNRSATSVAGIVCMSVRSLRYRQHAAQLVTRGGLGTTPTARSARGKKKTFQKPTARCGYALV